MNKKWLIAIYTMLSVFVVGVVTTVIVLASGTHYVGSNISVIYTASGIGGKLTATYQVGSNTAVNMVGNSGETVIEFGSEEPETVALLSPGGTIVPGYKEDIILTYTFVNEGPTFYATVTYTDTSSASPKDNIAITYKGESDTEYKKKSTVVTVPQLETVSYSIKLSIALPYMDASMDGMIKWALTEEEPIVEEAVTLSISNSGDSSVNDTNVSVVMNDDETQFKIVGAVPESAGPTTSSGYINGSYNDRNAVLDAEKGLMSVAELTNSSTGAEFFYFCTNPEVVGNTTYGYIDPGTIYWTSTSDTTLESWYDVPTEPITLYSCFMKPNFTGAEVDSSNCYNGTETQIVISNSVENILISAFYNKTTITNVAIPQSVKNISYGSNNTPNGAFKSCSRLAKIDLPNSVTSIGCNAFEGCSGLTSITIPDGVTSIGGYTFLKCTGLTSITIPSGVTSVGEYAFRYCTSLTSITIPSGVTSIGYYAFESCTSLEVIELPDSLTFVGKGALYTGCENSIYYAGTMEIFLGIIGRYDSTRNVYQAFGDNYLYSTVSTVFTIDCKEGRAFNQCGYCLPLDTEITCYDEKRKKWYKKKLKDITYKDKIVVWNFDEGKFDVASPLFIAKVRTANRYSLVKFSDGTELKTIGSNDGNRHRIFVKETGSFEHVNKGIIGKTTFNEKGEYVKVVDVQFVDEKVKFSTISTEYHTNSFANGILTSSKLSNLYKIEDMKYVKDNRELRPLSEFEGVDKKYYDGMRLAEQPRYKVDDKGNVEYIDWVEYVEKMRGLAGM